jgi:hypothetical protein
MTIFSDLRTALVADLAVLDVPIAPSWPDVLSPPCGFITPPLGGDYVVQGPMFGEFTVSLDLVLMVAHSDAEVALTALEALVEGALRHTADWTLTGVDPPAPTTAVEGGADYLASVIHLSKPTRLEV